jgi:hypothetical protein
MTKAAMTQLDRAEIARVTAGRDRHLPGANGLSFPEQSKRGLLVRMDISSNTSMRSAGRI